ncbi:winged helix-turn-helix transcriptional regulator [Streptomyces sp. NPDC060205]|uniref:winged helix-turn-helix transcriptional regulator n=1 Tax=Streptomyces sp. NPDC060205 TaxID=3347072 RepID=UPI003669C20C
MEPSNMKLGGGLEDRTRWSAEDCSIDAAMKVVGTRSAMLLMREAHYGTTRFDDFVSRVGISEAVASARLKELVAAQLLRREPYRQSGQRTRYEYVLTQAGVEFQPVLLALMQWGDRHLPREGAPPLLARHTECGSPLIVQACCEADHAVGVDEVTLLPRRNRRHASAHKDSS